MAEQSTLVQPSIPKFDGYYEHWSMLMENLIRSKELWTLIEEGVITALANATAEQLQLANESKLRDLKDIWDAMKRKYQDSTKFKRAQLQALQREFEILAMREGETVNEYFARTLAIVNRMTAHGERMEQFVIVEKILRSMTPKFNYVLCSIEESNDVTVLSVDELQSSLIVHEQRMKNQKDHIEEQTLKASSSGRGRGRSSQRGRGRGRQSKELVECFKCHKLGRYKNECLEWEENAHYAELKEKDMLLMAYSDLNDNCKEEAWYLNSGCSNRMVGNTEWLFEFDETFKESFKLGNDSKIAVEDKGNVKLNIVGKIHVITDVYYLPGLVKSLVEEQGDLSTLKLCLTFSVKDMTPEEAWSGSKPSVHHFRVFGCLAHTHVPDVHRKKLDGRSIKCVLFGVSEESKAYKLYDPAEKKIIVSKDVIFEETKGWDWDNKTVDKVDEAVSDTGDNSDIELENEQPASDTNEGSGSNNTNNEDAYLNHGNEDYVIDSDESNDIPPRLQNLAIALFSSSEDPMTYDEAVKSDKWKEAMKSELQSIEANDTWDLTTLPHGVKAIGVKWIFKIKYNEKGKIEKYKARLVAKGYSQRHGVDFDEVFAPIARWDTIRTVLSLAAYEGWCLSQLDVKSAFLHGELMENVYVEQPLGKNSILIVSVYVDDLIYTGNNQEMMDDFKRSMREKFAMSELGKMKYFLGIEVNQGKHGIFIHQQKYAYEILKRFGMQDCNKKKMIGCLMYLLATRPDLAFSMCLAARYMERPTEMHVVVVKRILRYIRGTLSLGIMYKYKTGKGLTVQGWSDSDYAGDYDDRRSTSGYVFTMGESVICWSSKKQPIVTLSTTEAEFVSVASYACHCIWLRNVLDHLYLKQSECTLINYDNSSSIKLSKNPIMHGRCQHIDVRYHFLRDLSKNGIIELK
ncbi:hypothetical protein TSUD_294490 [Trifolium subterraneum]|uniref:Uncharacterized protein n=1 Tax=Trifolium subterraneum TaxID=3900 RepID=A0A2Z6MS13_TRISU|nr:hypothetical protein TSUD_294490 [Trifolium subterraneum]